MNEVNFPRTVKAIKFGAWELDPKRQVIFDGDIERELEPLLFKILCYLLINNSRIITRQDLVDHVWCQNYVDDNAINRAMSELRKVLKSENQPGIVVKTHYRKGYSLFLDRAIIYHDSNAQPSTDWQITPAMQAQARQFSPRIILIAIITLLVVTITGYVFIAAGNSRHDRVVPTKTINPVAKKYNEQILSWVDGQYLLPILHPHEKFLAFGFNSSKSNESSLIIREIETGKEQRISIAGKELVPAGWSVSTTYLYFKVSSQGKCELWRLNYENLTLPHEHVMECDNRQFLVGGISGDQLVYSKYDYRKRDELSALVIRNIKTGEEFQLTSPNLNSHGDKFLFYDEKNQKVYFERVQFEFSEVFVTDIEGMEAKKLFTTSNRVWAINLLEHNFVTWYDNRKGTFSRYDLEKNEQVNGIKLLNVETYSIAYLLKNGGVISITNPFSSETFKLNLTTHQLETYKATNDHVSLLAISDSAKFLLDKNQSPFRLIRDYGQETQIIELPFDNFKDIKISKDGTEALLVNERSFAIFNLETKMIVSEHRVDNKINFSTFLNNNHVGLILTKEGNLANYAVVFDPSKGKLISLSFDNAQWFEQISENDFLVFPIRGEMYEFNIAIGKKRSFKTNESQYKHSFSLYGNKLFHSDGKTVYFVKIDDPQLNYESLFDSEDKFIENINYVDKDNALILELIGVKPNLLIYAKPTS
ncbi:transcriptional regulator [Pseudoalteromonas fenneropenaei]|uniref:Transcriptional regulator n=1 Tax=Pseudoalteromonas fenneropenaei TaxID=1737459 RepID=A0ABV7CKS3_9GAMM